ncbi:hypothetical protein C8Q77DRAFT_771560 [Trametes polyzona]|nr:hypothetical protein C8Q77DRAFT_771560 [Trametes polyzona]
MLAYMIQEYEALPAGAERHDYFFYSPTGLPCMAVEVPKYFCKHSKRIFWGVQEPSRISPDPATFDGIYDMASTSYSWRGEDAQTRVDKLDKREKDLFQQLCPGVCELMTNGQVTLYLYPPTAGSRPECTMTWCKSAFEQPGENLSRTGVLNAIQDGRDFQIDWGQDGTGLWPFGSALAELRVCGPGPTASLVVVEWAVQEPAVDRMKTTRILMVFKKRVAPDERAMLTPQEEWALGVGLTPHQVLKFSVEGA